MSWQRKQRVHNQSLSRVRVEGAAPRCHNCLRLPAVIRVHEDERRRGQRVPRCGYCGYEPRVEVTDEKSAREFVPPGAFGRGA